MSVTPNIPTLRENKEESCLNDPVSLLSNQTKNIFGKVQNSIKKHTNKVERLMTNATNGLRNLTEIGKPKSIFWIRSDILFSFFESN